MSLEMIALTLAITAVVTIVVTAVVLRRPKKLDKKEFSKNWKELQAYCRSKESWPEAIERADKLLDKALKKRKYKGETMGARMVSAQKTFSDNDGIWSAHNLYKNMIANPRSRIQESDIKDALMSYREALRDLEALPKSSNKKPLKVEK